MVHVAQVVQLEVARPLRVEALVVLARLELVLVLVLVMMWSDAVLTPILAEAPVAA